MRILDWIRGRKRILFVLVFAIVLTFVLIPNSYILLSLIVFWLGAVICYRFENRMSFLVSVILLCFCPIMILGGQYEFAENFSILCYMFLCFGLIQNIVERKFKFKKLCFINKKDISDFKTRWNSNKKILLFSFLKYSLVISVIFAFFWLGMFVNVSYAYIMSGKATLPIKVEFRAKDNREIRVNLFRISPRGNIYNLPAKDNYVWELNEKGFIRQLVFSTNNIENIGELDISVGLKKSTYTAFDLKTKWNLKDGVYAMPEELARNTLFGYGTLMNYAGDEVLFKYAFDNTKTTISYLFGMFLLISVVLFVHYFW